MPEDSTTPDPVELARRVQDAGNRRDIDEGFQVFTQRGRPIGSTGEVHQRSARLVLMIDGLIVRLTSYTDVDEARAAAERLAQEQG